VEAYIVHLANGIRIYGQGYALKPWWIAAQFWKYTRQITNTFFVHFS
jgi:hypothetical protein